MSEQARPDGWYWVRLTADKMAQLNPDEELYAPSDWFIKTIPIGELDDYDRGELDDYEIGERIPDNSELRKLREKSEALDRLMNNPDCRDKYWDIVVKAAKDALAAIKQAAKDGGK